MMEFMYFASFAEDPDDGFLVSFDDVPEALTHGKTHQEAISAAREALGLALRGRIADSQPLPAQTVEVGIPIFLAADDAMKLAVIDAFAKSDLSKSELARRMGKAENEARRILDPYHATGVTLLQNALSVLGKTVVVSVKDAA